MSKLSFPDGRRFAFTILDDTDVGTVENLRPIYDLLYRLGMRTTKTVWPVGCPEGSPAFRESETLEDQAYLAFVRELQDRGFEITWHGATMESSLRPRTLAALERFRELLGGYPRIHVNHAWNRENLYWGRSRIDSPLLRILYEALNGKSGMFDGDVEGSPAWWGDRARAHFAYARNLTFSDIDVRSVNPTLPYHDPSRPLIPWWFSAADANDVDSFNALLSPSSQERLEQRGGVCIVATHLGKRFAIDGEVNSRTQELLERLASRPGWFVPVGTLLDWLREHGGGGGELPAGEWRRMQWRWARDLVKRRFDRRRVPPPRTGAPTSHLQGHSAASG